VSQKILFSPRSNRTCELPALVSEGPPVTDRGPCRAILSVYPHFVTVIESLVARGTERGWAAIDLLVSHPKAGQRDDLKACPGAVHVSGPLQLASEPSPAALCNSRWARTALL
jgi:hypothetical protein